MNDYLKRELDFIRTFLWHMLLLCLVCIAVRSTATLGDISIGGVPLPINTTLFIIFVPVYALLVQFMTYAEATNLSLARLRIHNELVAARSILRLQTWLPLLALVLPSVASWFLIIQFFTMVAPVTAVTPLIGCQEAASAAHFLTHYNGPSMHCLRNVTEGNPWISLPYYDIALAVVGITTVGLGAMTIIRWVSTR